MFFDYAVGIMCEINPEKFMVMDSVFVFPVVKIMAVVQAFC